jgi:hypothetical protein
VARCWAGFALLGAGLIHLAVTREHVAVSLVQGLFFAVVGVAQLGLALVVLARDRLPAPALVVTGQLALVALWAVSRTTGLPVGPDAGTPEAVGRVDVLAVVLEVLSVAAVVSMAQTAPAPAPDARRPGRWWALVGAGALVMAALTTPALAATEPGAHARPHGGHADTPAAGLLPPAPGHAVDGVSPTAGHLRHGPGHAADERLRAGH